MWFNVKCRNIFDNTSVIATLCHSVNYSNVCTARSYACAVYTTLWSYVCPSVRPSVTSRYCIVPILLNLGSQKQRCTIAHEYLLTPKNCASWTSKRQHFLPSNRSRIQPLGLFSAIVDNPASSLLYSNSGRLPNHLHDCYDHTQHFPSTFSAIRQGLRHILRQSLPRSSTTFVIYQIWRIRCLSPTVGQACSSGDVLSRSAGRMYETVSLLL